MGRAIRWSSVAEYRTVAQTLAALRRWSSKLEPLNHIDGRELLDALALAELCAVRICEDLAGSIDHGPAADRAATQEGPETPPFVLTQS